MWSYRAYPALRMYVDFCHSTNHSTNHSATIKVTRELRGCEYICIAQFAQK